MFPFGDRRLQASVTTSDFGQRVWQARVDGNGHHFASRENDVVFHMLR